MSKQRILIVTLFISLIANAFFIGFAVTRMVDAPEGARKGGILHGVGARLTRNLDDPARQQIADALEALNPQYQQIRQNRRDNYQKLRELLAVSEPDRGAIETVLVEMREQSSGLVLTVHEEAVEAILKLPADQRAGIPDDNE
ncbi:MAG: periplasmic heavy metal sensor [Hyphomicrobiales bacterium]|nr:periplasmic heavy metal sensor [Hyphomicrobiales bacterium]MCP5001968.1 periplasmic heavy metal sensor [Hyphomicrobiales bacterium]